MFQPLIAILVAMSILICIASVAGAEEKAAAKGPEAAGLQHRIDFGNAYVLGQSIKSGAVYLLHRKQSEITGMLEVRQNYRTEIMEDYALEKTAMVSGESKEAPEKALEKEKR